MKKKSDKHISIGEKMDSTKKEIYLSSIVISLIVFFIFFERTFILVLRSNIIVQFGIIIILLIMLFFKPTKNDRLEISFTSIDFIWIFSIIVIQVYVIFAGIIEYYEHFIMYSIGIMLLVLAKANIDRFKTSFLIIKYSSILYAIMSIIHYLFTDIYHNIVFRFVPKVVQVRILELVSHDYYPGLGYAQPAIAAGYMIIGIGIIMSSISFRNNKEKIIDMFYIISLLLSVSLTGKRSILLWGILAMLITYYILSPKVKKISRQIKLLLGLVIVSFIVYIIFTYFDSIEFFNRLIHTINGLIAGEDVTSGRTTLYGGAWKLFSENPIIGIGWQQYIIITSDWFSFRDLTVHNVYLQLLAETGFVGFLSVVIALLYVLFNTYKVLKKIINTENNYNPLWEVGITFSFYIQIFFILYSLTENPFYNTIYILIYFYSITIINSFKHLCSTTEKKDKF